MNKQLRINWINYYENVIANALSEEHINYAKNMIEKLKNDPADFPLKYESVKRPAAARAVYCEHNKTTYESLKECAVALGINRNLASDMLKGLRGNKYGLSYVNKRNKNQFASKKIYCGFNEKTYNSILEAVKDLNIHRNTIQGQLKGRITNRLMVKYI